ALKSDVSPPSPVRVATRADRGAVRVGIRKSVRRARYARQVPRASAGIMEGPMPTGRGEAKDKNKKKKSKEQLERELKRKGVGQPVQPMTFEIVKPKRKEKENW